MPINFYYFWMLLHFFCFFLVGLTLFMLIPEQDLRVLRFFSLGFVLLFFVGSLVFLFYFDSFYMGYQFICTLPSFWGTTLIFGLDGISLSFFLLTTFLFPVTILAAWNTPVRLKFYFFNLLLLELFLVLAFTALDLITFFIFFEAVLVPMFFLVALWGYRLRRIRAMFLLVLYTLLGSICFLAAILVVYCEFGTTSFFLLFAGQFAGLKGLILWVLFFIGFSVKVPIFPFHIWLPEAHVEASTEGSMILASLLLKLGGYGFLRFFWECLADANGLLFPILAIVTIFSVFYASLVILVQMDLKKIIAYSSIAHMNMAILAIFTGNFLCLEGGFFLMIAHGIVSLALFFLVGVLYRRFKTRILNYYSGLIFLMPNFVLFLFLFALANFAFPLTSNFIGEILILLGLFQQHFFIGFLMVLTSVFGGIYSLWFLNRICFGALRLPIVFRQAIGVDLSWREFHCLAPLLFGVFLLGLSPQFFMELSFISLRAVLLVS